MNSFFIINYAAVNGLVPALFCFIWFLVQGIELTILHLSGRCYVFCIFASARLGHILVENCCWAKGSVPVSLAGYCPAPSTPKSN